MRLKTYDGLVYDAPDSCCYCGSLSHADDGHRDAMHQAAMDHRDEMRQVLHQLESGRWVIAACDVTGQWRSGAWISTGPACTIDEFARAARLRTYPTRAAAEREWCR